MGDVGTSRNVDQFRGRLIFNAHRLVYHSTLVLRVIKKKKSTSQRGQRLVEPGSISLERWVPSERQLTKANRDAGGGGERCKYRVHHSKENEHFGTLL